MKHENYNEDGDQILDKVLSGERAREIEAVRPSKVINNILNRLRERERDVLVARYGLNSENPEKRTLESIGQELSVTRERIRQIEKAVLKKIAKRYTAVIKPLWKIIDGYLNAHGEIVSLKYLVDYLGLDGEDSNKLEQNALRLAVSAHPQLKSLKKHPLFREGWIDNSLDLEKIIEIQKIIEQILEKQNKPMSEDDLIERIVANTENTDSILIKGILRVSSGVGIDNKDNWGLVKWSLVVPRRIRDKIFIVMEETNKPLHFKEITQLIQKKFPANKPTLSRTVHNELIGDPRFILVGRGIYALKDWGYKPGVVADVIQEILRKADQPMYVSDIIEAVMKHRQVKRNTVVANLQNRSLFKKVAKATYALVAEKNI